jgi:hypothetical protein
VFILATATLICRTLSLIWTLPLGLWPDATLILASCWVSCQHLPAQVRYWLSCSRRGSGTHVT